MGSQLLHKEFVEKYSKLNSNIEIIGEYVKSSIPIKCQCLICGYKWANTPNNLLRSQGCPVCKNRKIIKGINDIGTTHPDLVVYFKNKNDCYKNSYGSTKKVNIICPICGHEKKMTITHLVNRGFSCDICNDKSDSYPNRFAHSFFKQLPIKDYQYEYSPDWIKPYRYDNYFKYNNKEFIVEMDGEFHYKDAFGKTAQEVQAIDLYKTKIANEHGIEVIRIECLKSSPKYIKNNILKSKLATMFDLSNYDWDKCYKEIYISSYYPIWEYANNHLDVSCSIIGKLFNKSPTQMQNILKHGQMSGMCFYKPKLFNSKSVDVIENGKVIKTLPSIYKTTEYLYDNYGIKISHQTISRACNNQKKYNGLSFRFSN